MQLTKPPVCLHVFVMCTLTNSGLFFSPFLQFDEEFSARQEAQAEAQKKEEKIKELEEKIQALESQVNPLEEIPLNDFAK